MTVAIIPTLLENPSMLDKLLANLQHSNVVDRTLVFDNRPNPKHLGMIRNTLICFSTPKDEWIDAEGLSIYEMWNRGLGMSRGHYSLVLNDDIAIDSYVPSVLKMYLERDSNLGIVFPDYDATEDTGEYSLRYTDTTAGAGGMSGYCFMMKSILGIRVDENLRLYWGDDDLVKQVIAAGYKIARVVGLPVLHAGSYTINRMDDSERRRLMEADRAYFNQKYGENRAPV